MSPVPWNRTVAPVCALLGGTGLARVPVRRPVALPALLRARTCTPPASMRMVCEAADPLASERCATVC
jgi:hypothetical protein